MNTVEYLIWNDTKRRWLAPDERSWSAQTMGEAAVFTSAELAEDIRARETGGTDTTFVLGWLQ